MRRKAGILLAIAVLVLLALLVGGVIYLRSDAAARLLCARLAELVRDKTGLTLETRACGIGLLPPAIEVEDLVLANASGARPFSVERARVELETLSLLAGNIRIDSLELVRPHVHLGPDSLLKSEAAASGERPAISLPDWLPRALDVKDGRVDLVAAPNALLGIRGLAVAVRRTSSDEVRLSLQASGGGLDLAGQAGRALPLEKLLLRGNLLGDEFHLLRFEAGLAGSSLSANGAWPLGPNRGRRAQLSLQAHAPLSLLSLLSSEVPALDGRAAFDGSLELDEAGAPALSGSVSLAGAAAAGMAPLSGRADVRLDEQALSVEDIELSGGPFALGGKARVAWAGEGPFSGQLALRDFDLADLLKSALPDGSLTGRLGARLGFTGKLAGKNGLSAIVDGRLSLSGVEWRDTDGTSRYRAPSASLAFQLAATRRRLRLASCRMELPQGVLAAQGHYQIDSGDLALQASLSDVVLDDLAPVSPVALSGRASAALVAGGRLSSWTADVRLEGRDIAVAERRLGLVSARALISPERIVLDRLRVEPGDGTLAMTGTLERLSRTLHASATVDSLSLPQAAAWGLGRPVPALRAGALFGELEVAGTLENPQASFRLGFSDVEIAGQKIPEGGVAGGYREGELRLEILEARLGQGWIYAEGRWPVSGPMDLSLYSTGLRAGSFDLLAERKLPLDFRLDTHVTVKGDPRSPALEGWLKVYDTRLRGEPLPDSFFSAELSGDRVAFHGRGAGSMVKFSGESRLAVGLPFQVEGRVDVPNAGKLLWAGAPGLLALRGRIELAGEALRPASWVGKVGLDRLDIEAEPLRLKAASPWDIRLENLALQCRRCEIAGGPTSLRLSGGASWEEGPALLLSGRFDLGLLRHLTDLISRAEGQAEVKLDVRGPWERPALSGTASFVSPRLQFSFLPFALEEARGRLRFTPEALQLLDVGGRAAGGTFWVGGRIALAEGPRLALNIGVEGVRYDVMAGLWGRCFGTLSLSGIAGERLRLAGALRVAEGEFRQSISLVPQSSGAFRRRSAPPPAYDPRREMVDFDLRLSMPEGFRASYNLELIQFLAEMRGELRVVGTNQRLGLMGEVSAIEGTLSYLSKDFWVQTTRVSFSDAFSIRPRIELLASRSEVVDRGDRGGETEYRVELRLTGEGDDITVALRSEPPLDEADIVTLLSLGVTSRDIKAFSGEDLVGLGGEIVLRSIQLDERLGRVFPFPSRVVRPKYLRVQSRFSPKTQTTAPRLETGIKLPLISENLDLDYSRALFDDTDQSLEMNYRLGDGISTRLRWENVPRTPLGDTGLDLKLHWEW